MTLRISDTLSLPIEAASARFVALGKSGSGKTNAGVVLAEELVGAGVTVAILDVLGNMHGLRARPRRRRDHGAVSAMTNENEKPHIDTVRAKIAEMRERACKWLPPQSEHPIGEELMAQDVLALANVLEAVLDDAPCGLCTLTHKVSPRDTNPGLFNHDKLPPRWLASAIERSMKEIGE